MLLQVQNVLTAHLSFNSDPQIRSHCGWTGVCAWRVEEDLLTPAKKMWCLIGNELWTCRIREPFLLHVASDAVILRRTSIVAPIAALPAL